MDQLPTKVRPKKKYKTNRKDLDGGANPFELIKKGINNLSETLFPQTKQTFKDYYSGYIAKGAFNTKDGLFPSEFWKPDEDYFPLRKGSTDIYLPMKTAEIKKAIIKEPGKQAYTMEPEEFQKTFGRGVDIHKWIGKLPGPKAGFTPSNFKYMGPYNPVDQQLSCNLETGEVTEWKVKPYNKVDEITAYRDICYYMGKNKGDCDKEMIKSLDNIP